MSTRFTAALAKFDEKYHATDKAKGLDSTYGITEKAQPVVTSAWATINSFYEKAMGTPTGQKLAGFYTIGDKQVRDIHTEARRLADLKKEGVKGVGGGKTVCQCGGEGGSCPCKEGKCACEGCAKSGGGGMGEHTATGKADVVADSTGMAPLGEKQV